MTNNFVHLPVLLVETIEHIVPNQNLLDSLKKVGEHQIYIVDATIGGAGHATHLIQTFHQQAIYNDFFLNFIGIDQDIEAIKASTQKLENLKTFNSRFEYKLLHANFSELSNLLQDLFNNQKINIHGFYADFGVSSPQLDINERGFSFLNDGPLDMRMNHETSLTAEKILLHYSEFDLARIFYEFGEEPKSRLLARAIVKDRKESKAIFENTKSFAEYVKKILKYGYSRTHPATRIFQALRIEVNEELEAIQRLLEVIPNFVSPFGRAGFISFHSLEDRLVKRTMRLWQEREKGRENPRGGIIPIKEEIMHNPRARSARLRVFDFVG